MNSTKVKLSDMRTPRVHALEFDVPVQVLNDKFSDGKVERVEIQVESFTEGKEKPVFSYKNQILLLPKSPVSVKVTERYKAKEWSETEETSTEGSVVIPPLGHYPDKSGKDVVTRQVSTSIPPGCLMLKDTVAVRFEPENAKPWLCQEGEPRFTHADPGCQCHILSLARKKRVQGVSHGQISEADHRHEGAGGRRRGQGGRQEPDSLRLYHPELLPRIRELHAGGKVVQRA